MIGESTAKRLLRAAKRNRGLTAAELSRNYRLNHNRVSRWTINRLLTKNGLIARIKRKRVKMD